MKKVRFGIIVALNAFIFSQGFAQTWVAMDTGITHWGPPPFVGAIQEYNNTLYAGGGFSKAGSINNCFDMAQWNGVIWDSVKGKVLNPVNALQVYNGNLIAASEFSHDKGFTYCGSIVQWNGTTWSTLGPDTSFFINLKSHPYLNGVNSLTTYNGDLIAGGYFDSISGMYANNIASWNGTNWSSLGFGLTGKSTMPFSVGVLAMLVYNGNLYVGGYFDSAGGKPAKNITVWNGTSWSAMGSGINGVVNSLSVYKGNLYVGGKFDTVNGSQISDIAMWNGSNWSPVGGAISKSGEVAALTTYNGYLFAGGFFDTIDGIAANSIAYWNGTNWHDIGKGIIANGFAVSGGGVWVIYGYNNTIYAGGTFDTAGGIYALDIAMCAAPSSINEITQLSSFNLYPNPNNGIFTISFCHAELVSASQTNVEIYNVMGQIVLKQTLHSTQGDNLINLSGQPNGVYFYRVLNENGSLAGEGKLIIQK